MQPTERITIGRGQDGIELPLVHVGTGPKVLFLSGAEPLRRSGPWLEALARDFEVLVPIHPGFGGAPYVPHIRRPPDLALLYLSLLDDLGPAAVIGSSFGGWIAAEMAVKSCQAISRLVLIDSLGFKFAGPTDIEIVDLYGNPPADIKAAFYREPALRESGLTGASDEALAHIVEDRTAEAYYGWSPYMHTPDLHRWLHRIACPTLVLWGEADGIVPVSYGEQIAQRIPHARFQVVPRAAHYPHIETPDPVLGHVRDFVTAR